MYNLEVKDSRVIVTHVGDGVTPPESAQMQMSKVKVLTALQL